MKTFVSTAPVRFDYTSGQKPALKKGQAISKIKRIGICGADPHALKTGSAKKIADGSKRVCQFCLDKITSARF